jgi:putative transposase
MGKRLDSSYSSYLPGGLCLQVEGESQVAPSGDKGTAICRNSDRQVELSGMAQHSIRKTYKYKLTPTPAQAQALELVLSRCRTLYNVALEQRKTWWQRGQGKGATYYQQAMELPDLKAACPEYAEVNAQVLQDVLRRLEKTFQAFFQRVQGGETPGYPRFQGASRYHSFTYPQYGGGAVLDGGVLSLSKIGRIRIRIHRLWEGVPKTVTISREADGWYACVSCTDVPIQPLAPTGQETGVDLGLEAFATLADGARIFHPGWYRKAEQALKTAQRRVSRRQKGSNRRRKAVKLLAKTHLKVKRQRKDYHHKVALQLVQQHDTIYYEDLRTANMVKNHHLAKSISDAGWSQFLRILAFKAAYAGKRAVAVPPAFTSQKCSGCGREVSKGLSVRWHACPDCGMSLHRDHNAARNILRLGQQCGAGRAPQALT